MRNPLRSLALLALVSCAPSVGAPEPTATTSAALDAVPSFGPNPGNLLMYRHVPAGAPADAPLVVVLHGCLMQASDMASAGFDTLSDAYRFYVVYPQQQSANNADLCFDWFGAPANPADKTNLTRGQGENESIKEMVDAMKASFSIDAKRVYVVGFSGGGAMAAVMLAAWPDVFAAGGIAAGVPYGCPSSTLNDVLNCTNPGKTQTAQQWGQAVRQADPGFAGPWPRVSLWQGTADSTVSPSNEAALVAQWTDVHGLPAAAASSATVDGFPHAAYADGTGAVQVESWQLTGMGHAFPVDPAHGCGSASTYIADVHECAALRMMQFFGVVPAGDGLPVEAGPRIPDPTGEAPDGGSGLAPQASKGSSGCSAGGGAPEGGLALAMMALAAAFRRRSRPRRD